MSFGSTKWNALIRINRHLYVYTIYKIHTKELDL